MQKASYAFYFELNANDFEAVTLENRKTCLGNTGLIWKIFRPFLWGRQLLRFPVSFFAHLGPSEKGSVL